MTEIAAYGTWKSPISAADVARGATKVGFPAFAGDEVWWQESRPAESGRSRSWPRPGRRQAARAAGRPVVRPHPGARVRRPVVPAGAVRRRARPVRPRLRELRRPAPLPAAGDGRRAGEPAPLTPDGAGFRFADLTCPPTAGRSGACGNSRPDDGLPEPGFHIGGGMKVNRAIVAVPLDGSAAAGRRPPSGSSSAGRTSSPSPPRRRTAPGWRGSTGTIRGCPGTAPSCASARSRGPTAASGSPTRRWSWAVPRSPCWHRGGATTSPCTRSPTHPAGGTCTRRRPWPGPPPGRCTRPRRSSPGRSGSSAAARSSCSSDGRLAVLHGLGELQLAALDPVTGTLADIHLPGYRTGHTELAVSGTTIANVAGGPAAPWAVLRVSPARRARRLLLRDPVGAVGRRARPRLPAGGAPGPAAGRGGRTA